MDAAKNLAKAAAGMRWSATRDIAAALEQAGVRAVASQSKDLDALQTELFEIGQLSSHDAELELALSSTRASQEGKADLVGKLLGKKVSPFVVSKNLLPVATAICTFIDSSFSSFTP